MATTTALAIFGSSHPNDGGISPTHEVQLIEGDRFGWLFVDPTTPGRSARWWSAGPERLLSELTALAAVHIFESARDENLSGTTVVAPDVDAARIDAASRSALDLEGVALVLVVLEGSVLEGYTEALEEMAHWDVELAVTRYSRRWNQWRSTWDVSGTPGARSASE